MNIRLLALDVDGTLLNSRFQVSEANRRAIREAVARGIIVVLVTGRRFVIARPIALELGLATPLISHNGALTKNPQSLEVLDYHPLSASLARRVVEVGRRVGADMVGCYDPAGLGRVVVESISQDNVRLRQYLERASMVIQEVPDLVEYIQEDPIQIMTSGPCAKMDHLIEALADNLGQEVRVLKTTYPQKDLTIVDVVTSECSKAAALATVVAAAGLSPQQVMAIGDNHNDLEMLAFAGLGVVMGNAEDSMKSKGYYVTGSNDEDGVAAAISRFILAK